MTDPQATPFEAMSVGAILKKLIDLPGVARVRLEFESGDVIEEVKNVKPSEVSDECEAG